MTDRQVRMMCEACGSVVRSPNWRCDCTKIAETAHMQKLVPVPYATLGEEPSGGQDEQ